ncbi:hypothetical protein ABN36_18315 [Salmonella enterica subsp. enterica]|uniref:hypothetical protein n=1 Tax=Salmonella enterica TaxID=28901 RepID=UPI0009B10E77|nr:hypothetical protein [Salmonella enterica]ECH9540617.1 hypothetical protein [Salmonella enterica subsp. enterica]EGG4120944.1 hypothetical protein [Salmonella enterica]EGG4134915.1 hypothetical protein [Salmonella enterica]EGI6509433.1 hypothetical protein [Salmonella enterica subsp. enterica serovar Durham]
MTEQLNKQAQEVRQWSRMASMTSERVSCVTVEFLNELADVLESAGKRIAELEARTVKLPGAKFCPAEYAGSQLWEEVEIWNKAIEACDAAIRAADIGVKGE